MRKKGIEQEHMGKRTCYLLDEQDGQCREVWPMFLHSGLCEDQGPAASVATTGPP